MSNPIKIFSRTYSDIIDDLNTSVLTQDIPYWLKAIFAGIFYSLSVMINIIANQLFTSTVEARDIAEDLFLQTDYRLKNRTTASVDLTVNIDPALTVASTYTVSLANLKARNIQFDPNIPPFQWEARSSLTFAIGESTRQHVFYQQTSQDSVIVGLTDGSNSQRVYLTDKYILTDTMTLLIGTDTYTPVDTFAFSTSTDLHFIHKQLDDFTSYIEFGFIDEVSSTAYGKIPLAGQNITATYSIGGGLNTNVDAATITEYIGGDTNVLSINNIYSASGGSDGETIENAKRIAPLRARTHDQFWNVESGIVLGKQVNGVIDIDINFTGILACDVYVTPYGGGYASLQTKNAVYDTLLKASPFEQAVITIKDPNYQTYIPNISIELFSGYILQNTPVQINDLIRKIKLMIALRTYELSYFIIDYYSENGLENTVNNIINVDLLSLTGFTYDSYKEGYIEEYLKFIKTEISKYPQNRFYKNRISNDDIIYCLRKIDGIKRVVPIYPSGVVSVGTDTILKPTGITVSEI